MIGWFSAKLKAQWHRRRPERIQRILVIATRQIGDVLCTTPLMARCRELWPHAQIDVLGYEKTMGMLVGNPDINQVIESEEHPKWPGYRRLLGQIYGRYDLAIVTQPSDRAHLYGLLAAPLRVGMVPPEPGLNWWKKWLCWHTETLDYLQRHVVLERLALLQPFEQVLARRGLISGDHHLAKTPRVVPPAAQSLPPDLQTTLSALQAQGHPIVVLHATPMWRFKRWPLQAWVRLVAGLTQQGCLVLLTGSPSAQDRDMNQAIVDQLQGDSLALVMNIAGRTSLAQLTTLLKKAAVYIGVDTSVTHQAAASGLPTIALFGPTPPTNFGPWPQGHLPGPQEQAPWQLIAQGATDQTRCQTLTNVSLVQGPGACVPCRKAGCENRFESHSDCLDQLDPELVLQLALERLPKPISLSPPVQ